MRPSAAIRVLCGYVDAIIDLRDRVLVMTLRSARPSPDGDEAGFGLFIAHLSIDGA